ncbi:hypothetical protein SAMN05192541_12267 [Bradyrhizobium arachidis]|nr:hypothetical protein SAMN05192541_12267 [Bradyrhizobium arachidis]
MRESSHFDGHQITGYNRNKKIAKLEVLTDYSMRVTESLFPRPHWGGPYRRRYVDRINLRRRRFCGR